MRLTLAILVSLCPFSSLLAQDAMSRNELAALGQQYDTAWEMYEALREQAGGGDRLVWDSLPDWGGIWSKTGGPGYETGRRPGTPVSAKLTPDARARYDAERSRAAAGNNFDPLSACAPAGLPRWFSSGYLREHVVTPDQTWLMTEYTSEVRRIYTDGRAHPSPDYVYPLVHGDSIGFWDDGRLIIHTNQVSAGVYGRDMLEKSEALELVEIWQKQDNGELTVDVWHYDPPILAEPWHVRHTYAPTDDENGELRIRHWYCEENQNNQVYQTDSGGTDYSDLSFIDDENDQ